MATNRLTGSERTVTRQLPGGETVTLRRGDDGLWQCVERPMAMPQRHLRDALRMLRRTHKE